MTTLTETAPDTLEPVDSTDETSGTDASPEAVEAASAPAEAVEEPVLESAPEAAEPEAETAQAAQTAPLGETPAPVASFTPHDAAGPSSDDAVEDAHDDETPPPVKKSAKDEFVEIARTIFYALLIALVLRIFLFQPFTIPSASMEPNLYEGDYLIVSKWSYGYSKHSIPFSPPLWEGRILGSKPQRGDIAVFKLPRDDKTDYIKRVVGLPGDTIQVRDNKLFVNGVAATDQVVGTIDVPTPYGTTETALKVRETLPGSTKAFMTQDFRPDGELDNTGLFVVPEGHYFMMGDNRDNSIDSRVREEYGVGLVPEENLVGKAQIILFSWSPGASLFKPWTWFANVRPSRFFTPLQ